MKWRTTLACAASIAALTALSRWAGPRWRTTPVTKRALPERTETTIGVPDDLTDPSQPVRAGEQQYAVRSELATVDLGGAQVEVMVVRPDAAGRWPVVLFMHGAGTGNHAVFLEHARALASHGIAAVVPDKRLDTYQTLHRNYPAMAADYGVSLQWAASQPWACPDQMGLYAESESGWIAPILAADNPAVAFVILVSSPVVEPRQQFLYAMGTYLLNIDAPRGLMDVIPRVIGIRLPPGWFDYARFDVQPYQRRMRQPILVVYGGGDLSMPVEQGARQVIDDAAVAGNTSVTVRYYDQANHGIRFGSDQRLCADFLSDTARWIHLRGQLKPSIAGERPSQPYACQPVPDAPWWGGTSVQAAAMAASLVAICGSGIGLVSMRHRDPALTAGMVARQLAATGGALGSLAGYFFYVSRVANLALNYRSNRRLVRGGYLAARAAGAAGAAALGVAAVDLYRAHRAGDCGARQLLSWTGLAGALELLAAGSYWGMFGTSK